MKAKILKLAFLCTILSSAPQASAQNVEGQIVTTILNYAWSRPENCNDGNASEVGLGYAIAHQDQFLGKCIKTKGYYSEHALLTDIEDIDARYHSSSPFLAARRIGVLGKKEFLDELRYHDAQEKIEIIGKVRTCEKLAVNFDGFSTDNYCHHARGPIILMASYSW
ncbi:MAG: hypothetical protein FD163_1195 [Hyphomonadaceae bacterium]|nr:MAG: hypothetical protein FD128_2304 [Hyphomonadaceae bacterium]KAF0185380.1 MAG: hypothetical protein FD163_1195 [Hyphomonadaceae bacterium]